MLDEIAPALRPYRKSKTLTAEPGVIEMLPMVESKISFVPFVNYLRKRKSVSDTQERLYNYLIKRFESEPSLLNVQDAEIITTFRTNGTADDVLVPGSCQ